MLHAATPAEMDFIRRVLAEGAADGSFDPELAGNSPSASLFYANLGEALRSGYLRVPDANGNLTREVHVAGYVYATQKGLPPVGFGLFKALGDVGFELWLTGISADLRGHGHGRAMLAELLATPAGQMTWLIRCNRKSTLPRCRHASVSGFRVRVVPDDTGGALACQFEGAPGSRDPDRQRAPRRGVAVLCATAVATVRRKAATVRKTTRLKRARGARIEIPRTMSVKCPCSSLPTSAIFRSSAR